MRKKTYIFLVFFLAFGILARSSSLKKDLKISLEEKQIQNLTTQGLNLVFYVKISNFSRSVYYFSGYDYRFVVNHREYIHLESLLESKIKIDALSDTLLSFPIKITYSHLFRTIEGLEQENKALCYLTGTMKFSNGRRKKGKLNFAFSGEFPIFKKPEIEFIKLRVNDLTIGGADLDFEVQFKNNNGFELLVDNITYALQLGGKTIGKDKISGHKNIKSRSNKIFSLPLLLNFFEVSQDVRGILQQTSALCRFSGEIKVRTIWGSLNIPFDKKERISISRIP